MLTPRDGGDTILDDGTETPVREGRCCEVFELSVVVESGEGEEGEEVRDEDDGTARRFNDLSLLNAGLGGASEVGRSSSETHKRVRPKHSQRRRGLSDSLAACPVP